MQARIARHFSHDKKLKWHIDYLLLSPHVSITKVTEFLEPECIVNQNTSGLILVHHFGATDCRAACGSHLKYLPEY